MTLLGVVVAGALGAPARYLLERALRPTGGRFPLGTFAVNLTGSFAIGVVTGAALVHGFSPQGRAIVGTGFLGAYTTFSTYAYEVVRRGEESRPGIAAAYALGSLVLGVALAAAGMAVTGAL